MRMKPWTAWRRRGSRLPLGARTTALGFGFTTWESGSRRTCSLRSSTPSFPRRKTEWASACRSAERSSKPMVARLAPHQSPARARRSGSDCRWRSDPRAGGDLASPPSLDLAGEQLVDLAAVHVDDLELPAAE